MSKKLVGPSSIFGKQKLLPYQKLVGNSTKVPKSSGESLTPLAEFPSNMAPDIRYSIVPISRPLYVYYFLEKNSHTLRLLGTIRLSNWKKFQKN